ncbi:nucleoside triphosphatase YtkD [Bacillus carboniphilus]|uniref:Nucleoside triphosphatase YtkD n=1 Tax=Bacillus carboniphilus TaxID=86663 RepID=A0ABY9JY37_9BACI|nr:nucleoside triphosphatase YtkD [Bacillus carboniphilus]WLR44306.1 nucleoside triphosphatase YtkD [Bacillus carboniphilus]
MSYFYDYYRNQIQLSFDDHPFSENPKHVWVVCRFDHHWLLTKHKHRGFEFPGGKVEEGEIPLEAACREVEEETGGIVNEIKYIGQYKVVGKGSCIIKNIYFAYVSSIVKKHHYFETWGPILVKEFPNKIIDDDRYSFIMKDDVLPMTMEYIEESGYVVSGDE